MFGLFTNTFNNLSYVRRADSPMYLKVDNSTYFITIAFLLAFTVVSRIAVVGNSHIGFLPYGIIIKGLFIWTIYQLILRLIFEGSEINYINRLTTFQYFICMSIICIVSVSSNLDFLRSSGSEDPKFVFLLTYGFYTLVLVFISQFYLILISIKIDRSFRFKNKIMYSPDNICYSIFSKISKLSRKIHWREALVSNISVFVFILMLLPADAPLSRYNKIGSDFICAFKISFINCPSSSNKN